MSDCCDDDNVPDRLLVLKRLCTLIEGVKPEDGYVYDLRKAVYRGRAEFGEESESTMVAILETPRADYGSFAGNNEARSEDWVLYVQGTAPIKNNEHPTDHLYTMAAEVQQRLSMINRQKPNTGNPLFPEHYLLGLNRDRGPLIAGLQIQPPVVVPSSKSTPKPFFYITLRVKMGQIL